MRIVETAVDERAESKAVALFGEFDLTAVEMWNMHTAKWLARWDGSDYVIDLIGLEFIDASGMGALIGFSNALGISGHRMHLQRPSPAVRRAFVLAHLANLMPA